MVEEPQLELVESAPLPYVLSLPQGAKRESSPVLCFLHGYDEAAPLAIRRALTRHGPLRTESSVLARQEFIVIAPQLPQAGDLWHRYAGAVQAIVSGVQRMHGGDPRRSYLTGFSYGGNGVFDLGLEQAGFWAALWAVDPTRVPEKEVMQPVWLSIGAVARRASTRFIRALRLKPVITAWEEDRVYLDEGADHVAAASRAYRDDRIYRWLLARRRP